MSSTKRKNSAPAHSPSSKKRKHKHKNKSSAPNESAPTDSAITSYPQLFQKSRLKIHVAIPPAASFSPEQYIQSYLTSNILLKHTENGTIVAFSGFKSISGVGGILDECPFSWSWFEGDVVLFNPQIGQRIRGIVAVSSPDHLALITHALFNVSIPRTNIPEEWTYDETWFDGDGRSVDGELEFEVDYNKFDIVNAWIVTAFIEETEEMKVTQATKPGKRLRR